MLLDNITVAHIRIIYETSSHNTRMFIFIQYYRCYDTSEWYILTDVQSLWIKLKKRSKNNGHVDHFSDWYTPRYCFVGWEKPTAAPFSIFDFWLFSHAF